MEQLRRLNQIRSKHRTSVEATVRALLVAWALHEGTTSLLRTLVSATATTETVVSSWLVSGLGLDKCGSRCRAVGRRPASRCASRVCAAFCVAGHGVEGIRNALCGRGWHNERAHASAVSNKWHKGYAGWGPKYAQMGARHGPPSSLPQRPCLRVRYSTWNGTRRAHEAVSEPGAAGCATIFNCCLSRLSAGASTTLWHNYAMIAWRAKRLLAEKRPWAQRPAISTPLTLLGPMASQAMVRAHMA